MQCAQKSSYLIIDSSINQALPIHSSVAINQLKPQLANYIANQGAMIFLCVWACESRQLGYY
jgi:hypothetical protein